MENDEQHRNTIVSHSVYSVPSCVYIHSLWLETIRFTCSSFQSFKAHPDNVDTAWPRHSPGRRPDTFALVPLLRTHHCGSTHTHAPHTLLSSQAHPTSPSTARPTSSDTCQLVQPNKQQSRLFKQRETHLFHSHFFFEIKTNHVRR